MFLILYTVEYKKLKKYKTFNDNRVAGLKEELVNLNKKDTYKDIALATSKIVTLSILQLFDKGSIGVFYNGRSYNVFRHSKAQGATIQIAEGGKKITKQAVLGLQYKDIFISFHSLTAQVNNKIKDMNDGKLEEHFKLTAMRGGTTTDLIL